MAVVVIGINERDVPLDVFEQAAVAERDLPKALQQLGDSPNLSEVVVLSTCLRTEVYAVVERFHDGVDDIESFYRARTDGGGSKALSLSDHLYCWYDEAAVAHLFDVAAGIDSPVLGEGEILRQVRDAAELARTERASGPVLSTLFRHAVEAGKRVRTETSIARGTTSLAHAAVALAADQLEDGLQDRHVLVVGAGEMGAGFAKALAQARARGTQPGAGEAGSARRTGAFATVVVANRSAERASEVAAVAGGSVVGLDELERALVEADVVLSSTAAEQPVLTVAAVRAAVEERAGRPLLIVDMAVPRDVAPGVAELAGVTLLDVEDVRRFAEAQMASRRREVPVVRALLATELERYRVSAAERSAAPVVAALHARAEQLRRAELERQAKHLEDLGPDGRALVELVSQRIVAKLLHEPSVRVKDAAGSPRGERLAEALRALFDL